MNHDTAIRRLFAERFFLQELTEDECGAYEEHFLECTACADQVKSLFQFIQHAKELFAADTLESFEDS
jgi:hypothetical protein